MDREIVLRARHGERVPLLRSATFLLAAGALLLAIVGQSLLTGSTRQPATHHPPDASNAWLARHVPGRCGVGRPARRHRASPDQSQGDAPPWAAVVDGRHADRRVGRTDPSTSSIHPGEIYVMDADGGGIRSITPTLAPIFVDGLAWSPDDRRIAIASEGRLFVADTDGGRAIAMQVALIPADMLRTTGMSWSPDSNELAVAVPRAGSDTDGVLEVVDVRTGDVTVVPMAGSLGFASIGQASWSPTGDAIAYVATVRLAGDRRTHQHLMVAVRGEGSWATTVLVHGLEPRVLDQQILQLSGWPAWSNDGTRFALIRGAFGEDLALWVAKADGSAPRKLATLPVSDLGQLGPPAWLPDDSRIAVPNVPESRLSFLLVDPDGIAPAVSLEGQGGTVDWQGVAP